jgi:hypothetical protein
MTLNWRSLDVFNRELATEISLSGHVYRSLDSYLDVDGELSGQMNQTGSLVHEGRVIAMKLSGPMTIHSRSSRNPGAILLPR